MKIQMKCPAIAFCICAAMLATGCSQDEALTSPAGGIGRQVPLTITSAALQTEVTATRASTQLGAGATIGVFLDNVAGSSSYTRMYNVPYSCGGAAWSPGTEAARIYLTSDDANVCAYYPYRNNIYNNILSLAPRLLADGEAPLAYATYKTVNADNKNVTFSMTQACSWLVIAFKRGNTKDDITLSEFSLTNSGLYKESVLNITDGSTTDTAADGGKVTFTGDIALPKNSTVTRNLSMPPSSALTGGLKVSVKVKEYGNKVLSTTLTGLTALARGYKYAVTLTVDGSELGISSVEVLPWTTTTVNNGGSPWVPLP
mgnify:CR=1 FL=1